MAKFSVKKPYTVLVGVVLAIVLGVVSFMKMTTDLLPNISLPYVLIMTTYVGASPETVETVVTQPIEASMATVSNIESVSYFGVCTVCGYECSLFGNQGESGSD